MFFSYFPSVFSDYPVGSPMVSRPTKPPPTRRGEMPAVRCHTAPCLPLHEIADTGETARRLCRCRGDLTAGHRRRSDFLKRLSFFWARPMLKTTIANSFRERKCKGIDYRPDFESKAWQKKEPRSDLNHTASEADVSTCETVRRTPFPRQSEHDIYVSTRAYT